MRPPTSGIEPCSFVVLRLLDARLLEEILEAEQDRDRQRDGEDEIALFHHQIAVLPFPRVTRRVRDGQRRNRADAGAATAQPAEPGRSRCRPRGGNARGGAMRATIPPTR